mgnify:CR=1 FL=1
MKKFKVTYDLVNCNIGDSQKAKVILLKKLHTVKSLKGFNVFFFELEWIELPLPATTIVVGR